jgi:hypothetical protein
MHNLHLIVVKAETGYEACQNADAMLSDWGTENNWRTMCGAVSEDNETYDARDGRFRPDADTNTIDKLNDMVQDWMKESTYGLTAQIKLKRGKKIENFNSVELWSLRKYAEHLYAVKTVADCKKIRRKNGEKVSKKFSVLEDEFFQYQYDECGVTRLEDADDDGKLWVVFCDMHS